MNDRLKPQLRVDSFSLEQGGFSFQLYQDVFEIQLQHRIIPSSPIADFFSALTSPPTSLIR